MKNEHLFSRLSSSWLLYIGDGYYCFALLINPFIAENSFVVNVYQYKNGMYCVLYNVVFDLISCFAHEGKFL
jgi:hypothetical protein